MPRIPLISEKIDTAKPKFVPKDRNLNVVVDRFRPPGGKPPLPMRNSYNRQGGK